MRNRGPIRGGLPPYSEDRAERAMALFAAYAGRATSTELDRRLISETRMSEYDHLVGSRKQHRNKPADVHVFGVVCEGFAIIDCSAGEVNWVRQQGQAVRERNTSLHKIRRELEALDIADWPM